MKEQIISFKTAKLAKEKKFPYLSEKCYYDDKGSVSTRRNVSWHTKNIIKNNWEILNAPTQTLVQKWLLEKHGIHIQIRRLCLGVREEKWDEYNDFIYMPGENEHLNITLGNEFDTYEQALENAIYESLKLIKTK